MLVVAVLSILGSSVLHAAWNLLLKQAGNKLAFTAICVALSPVYVLPYLLIQSPWRTITPEGWLCILAAGALYAVYYEALARAYARGELSVVYPVARGVGPALAFLLGMAVLSEQPTSWGTLGVVLILGGVYSLHRRSLRIEVQRPGAVEAIRLALLVGAVYSLYSLVDKVGVSHLGIDPVTYIGLTFLAAALFVVPRVIRIEGRVALSDEWRANARLCAFVAALNLVSYLLILFAFTLPKTPIGYVVPLRATSGLIGVAVGAKVLQERDLAAKLLAALCMLVGIVLISVRG